MSLTDMTVPVRGEEFRDDARKKLPREVLAPLTRIDPLRSTFAVAANPTTTAIPTITHCPSSLPTSRRC